MSLNGLNSNQSDIYDNKDIHSPNSELSNNFEILISELNESLKNPTEKEKISSILLDQEINNLNILSFGTPIPSEELIINENIDYIMNDSVFDNNSYSTSKNITFNYTKSDKMTPFSSVFQSFERLNL